MRKAGQVEFSQETLAELLHLPEGTKVRDISVNHTRDTFTFVLEGGDWLPEVPENGTPPDVLPQYTEQLGALLTIQREKASRYE